MKKLVLFFMLLALLTAIVPESNAQSAFQQLQQSAGDSDSAANSYSGGSIDYEDTRDTSGYTFDTPSSSPPPVDLTGAGDHPTPMLLREPGE